MNIFQRSLLACSILCTLCFFSTPIWAFEDFPINVRDRNVLVEALNSAERIIEQQPETLVAYKKAGIAAHQLALFFGNKYADKAVKYLSVAIEKDPEDAVMRAYLGSSYALQGREGTAVMQKISLVNKGLSLLNSAVQKAPQDFFVRIVRASVLFELPPMFKQKETAYADLLVVESHFETMQIDPELKAEIYYKLCHLAAEKDDDLAKNKYQAKAMEVAPASKWASLAKKE